MAGGDGERGGRIIGGLEGIGGVSVGLDVGRTKRGFAYEFMPP